MASFADITESILDFFMSFMTEKLVYKLQGIVQNFFSLGLKICFGALVTASSTMHNFGSLAQLIATAACAVITLTVGAAICHISIVCLIKMGEHLIKFWKAARKLSGWVLRAGGTLLLYAAPVLILSYLWNPKQPRIF
jgi:hypothetical protein